MHSHLECYMDDAVSFSGYLICRHAVSHLLIWIFYCQWLSKFSNRESLFFPLQLTLILREEIWKYPAPQWTSPPDLALIDDSCLRMKNDSCLYWDGCKHCVDFSTLPSLSHFVDGTPTHLTPHLSIYLPIHHKGQLLHSYFTQWIIIRYYIYFFWCSNRGPWQPL